MRNHFNFSIALLADLYGVAQISNAIVDLDLIMQEFLEGGNIEDLVGGGLGSIDDELRTPHLAKRSSPKNIACTESVLRHSKRLAHIPFS